MRKLGRFTCWLVLLLGCNRGSTPLTPVKGQVYHRGHPLAGGTVVFTPDEEKGGRGPLALGEIDSTGHFQLTTGGQSGAVSGWHRITVAPPSPRPGPRLASRYRDPDQSGLSFEVRSDRPNDCTLHLD